MKTLLASLALATTTALVATPAQAATTSLVFNAPSLDSGTLNQVGSVYRYSEVTTGVDLLLEITGSSTNAVIDSVGGNEAFFDSSTDNLILRISRSDPAEEDTFVNLNFTFVEAGTNTATSISDVILTVGDIDSNGGDAFSDYFQVDPTQFSSFSAGGDLTAQDMGGGEIRYIYSFPGAPNIPNTSPDQVDVSLILGLNGISTFTGTWGYFGAGEYNDRGLLLDGSNELAVDPVPEPASAALLGLGGLALLARRRR